MKPRSFSYFFALFFLFVSDSVAQSFGDYRSNSVQMNWETSADWQIWDTLSSSWLSATNPPDSSKNFIRVQQGHTVTLSSTLLVDQLLIEGTLKNTGSQLIITDGIGDDLLIHRGGKLLIENNSLFINRGKLIMQDSIINRSSCTFTNEGTLVNKYAYFLNSGSLLNKTNSRLINSGDFLTEGIIIFENKSLYQHDFPSLQPTAGTIPIATWKTGSTCEIVACGDAFQPGALNQTFHHFIWNNSTQPHDFNLIANPNIVNGNFEIKNTNQKKLAYKGGSAGDLVISDSFKITGGNFILTNGTGSTSVKTKTYFQDTGMLDMSASISVCSLFVSGNFIHTGGIVQRSGSAASGCILINGAGLSSIISHGFRKGDPLAFIIRKESNMGICTVPIQQSFILQQGTSFSLSDNSAASIDFKIDGTFSIHSNSWDLTNGVTLITGSMINNTSLPVSTNSTISSLHFDATSLYIHTGDGGEVVSAKWDSTSTLQIKGMEQSWQLKNGGQHFGNIFWKCVNQKQSCIFGEKGFEVQGNYTIESTGAGILHFPDFDFNINGDLLLKDNSQLQLSASEGLYDPSLRKIQVRGNLFIQHTALLQVGNPNAGNAAAGTNLFREYRLLIGKDLVHTSTTPLISYHHRAYENGNKNESYRLSFCFNGNRLQHYIIPSVPTEIIALQPTEYVCNNAYELIVSGNGTQLIPQQHNVKVHRLWVDEADTLTIGGDDIHIHQFASFTFDGKKEPSSCVIYGTLNMGMNTLKETNANEEGIFQLMENATLVTKHPLGIEKVGSTGCILNSGERLFNEAANYIYNGHMAQITGTGLPSDLSGSLTIDNTVSIFNGGVTLSKPLHVKGSFYLNTGKLITTLSSPLLLGNSAIVSPDGGRINSFVDGLVMKTGISTGHEFIFPLGHKSKWARLGITPSTPITDTISASYFMINPKIQNSIVHDSSLHHISSQEYWTLAKTDTPIHALVKLYWESGTFSRIYSIQPSDLKLAHADTVGTKCKWKSESIALAINGSPNKGNIQAHSLLHTNNLFTFGSGSTINPLPVELLSFTGNPSIKGNALNWVTASEKGNDFFIIQRSNNGNQFSQVAIVNGHEHSSTLSYYSHFDSILSTTSLYYRLKQVDTDGKYTYSSLIRVDRNSEEDTEFTIFPNPAIGEDIHIVIDQKVKSFSIYNVLGKKLLDSSAENQNRTYVFSPSTPGVYFIRGIMMDGKITTKKIIKN